MGVFDAFDGLFGSDESAKFDVISPFDLLPADLKPVGKKIGKQGFGVFKDLITKGETRAAEELFSRSRTATLKDFGRATNQAGLNLNRLGLASSGTRDRTFASLALSLGDVLAAQDAKRSEALRSQQVIGSTQGLNAINSLAGGTALIPQQRQSGLFDGIGTSLIGLGTSSLLGGLGGGIGSVLKGGGFGAGFGQGLGNAFGSTFGR